MGFHYLEDDLLPLIKVGSFQNIIIRRKSMNRLAEIMDIASLMV